MHHEAPLTSVTYVSRRVGGSMQPFWDEEGADRTADAAAELEWLSREVLGEASTRYVTVLKAAGSGWHLFNRPDWTSWLLGRSAAIVSDETGLVPWIYATRSAGGGDDWVVRGYGNYERLHKLAHQSLMIKQNEGVNHAELANCFRGRELPFVWGYGTTKARGVMLTAWHSKFLGAPEHAGSPTLPSARGSSASGCSATPRPSRRRGTPTLISCSGWTPPRGPRL